MISNLRTLCFRRSDARRPLGTRAMLLKVWVGMLCLSLVPPAAAEVPTLLVEPRGGEALAGDSFAFDVLAEGDQPLAYQWWVRSASAAEFVLMSGATNFVLSLTQVTAADEGSYRVVVANSSGSVTSRVAVLSVSDPVIRFQPLAATRMAGTNVFMVSVDARGTGPLHYQWETNGVDWAGQTNPSVTLPVVTKDNEGSYRVRITNLVGSVLSDSVQVSVVDPAFVEQPVGGQFNAGDSVTLSATVAGTAGLSFEWLYQGTPIAGATNRTVLHAGGGLEISTSALELTALEEEDSGSYTVRVRNRHGTVTSEAATLDVRALGIAFAPANISTRAGETVTNGVLAFGTPPLDYQWYFTSVATGQTGAVPGGTTNLLVLTNVSGADAGDYWVVVSNASGSTESAPVVLTVEDPWIEAQPENGVGDVGGRHTNRVGVVGTGPLRYQWYLDNALVTGATNATLVFSNLTLADAGTYTVRATNEYGQVSSVAADLAVYDLAILSQPESAWRVVGESFEAHVTARGTQPLSFQWYHGADPVPGQTQSNLELASVTVDDAGAYWVAVTNAVGQGMNSASGHLMVFDPVIRQQPRGGTVAVGTNVNLMVIVEGTGPFTYEWLLNGVAAAVPVQSDNPTNTLALNNVEATDSGLYSVRISNASGSLLSAEALLTVGDPYLTMHPQSAQLRAGDNFTNAVQVVGTDPLSYQWFHDGLALAGETNAVLILTNVTSGQSGLYAVTVTSLVGSAQSASAFLTVQDPVILEQPRGGSVSLAEAPVSGFTFHVKAAGAEPMVYQWYFNGTPLAGKVESTLALGDLSERQAGDYAVEVRNALGTVLSSNATLTLSSQPPRTLYDGSFTVISNQAAWGLAFDGNGMENRVSFSVRYDPLVLANPVFSLGTNAPVNGATLRTSLNGVAGQMGIDIELPAGETFPPEPIGLGSVGFDVVGTNALEGRLAFTNTPTAQAAADVAGATLSLRSSLRPTLDVLDTEPWLNRQTGLFEQRFRLANPTAVEANGVVVSVGGLGVDALSNAIAFANAHTGDYFSDPDGDGIVDTITRDAQVEVERGSDTLLTLEFYVSDRITLPEPETMTVSFGDLGLPVPSEGTFTEVRSLPLGTNGVVRVEFLTQTNSTYYVVYGETLKQLANPAARRTSLPLIQGTGGYVRWIDNGPPRTVKPPWEGTGTRYYQILKSP